MLKAVIAQEGKAHRLVVFGLSDENVTRLRAGMPIRIRSDELGLSEDLTFVICHGETEKMLADELREHGLPIPENAGA